MSIDYEWYEWLRNTVETVEARHADGVMGTDASTALEAIAPKTAREVLRLRDGIEPVRASCAALAEGAQEAGMHALATEMRANVEALTKLLEGDAE